MELSKPNSPKKQIKKTNTTPIRVFKATAKTLKSMIQKLDKKSFGRKVRVDDLILKSLSLLEDKHLEEIRDATLSNTDKLEISYQEYCKTHGQISKDEYLGRLLSDQKSAIEGTANETRPESL